MKALPNDRLTIGLVLDNLRRNSGSLFWSSMINYCKSLDINLIIIPGESLASNRPYAYQHHVLYDFLRGESLDGMILMTNLLGDFVARDTLDTLYDAYLKVPFVSMNLDLKGAITTIHCDNNRGIMAAMNHLIVHHGYKKIGFIKGQEEHKDAIERFEAYKESLKNHHIEYDDSLVVEGDFYIESGRKAVEILVDQRGVEVDAILACNDEMAIGAIEALKKRGIQVPKDMKVVGFDDIQEISFEQSPLASVRQPLREMAEVAIQSLLKHIHGEKVIRHQYVIPEYIPRASCGCLEKTTFKDIKFVGYDLIDEHQTIDNFIGHYVQKSIYSYTHIEKDIIEVVHGVIEDCQTEADVEILVEQLKSAIYQEHISIDYIRFLSELLEAIHKKLLTRLDNMSTVRFIDMLFGKISYYLKEMKVSTKGFDRIIRNMQREYLMVESLDTIASASTMDELMQLLEKSLRKAGINSCAINFFKEDVDNTSRIEKGKLPKKSVMALGYNDRIRFVTKEPFKTKRIVPKGFKVSDRPYAWVVEPLYFKDEAYGYMVYEMGIKDGGLYESIRRQLSITIHYLKAFDQFEEQKWV